MTVTDWAAVCAGQPDRRYGERLHHGSELLSGTLVHRLLQFLDRDITDREEIKRRALGLLRGDEKAGVDNCDALVNRAAEDYLAILEQADVMSRMDADCLFELPFSLRLEPRADDPVPPTIGAPVIVRGTIDCPRTHVGRMPHSTGVQDGRTPARTPGSTRHLPHGSARAVSRDGSRRCARLRLNVNTGI